MIPFETDEELRRRLRYVAGDGDMLLRIIAAAAGEKLDELASHYNLRRLAVLP